MSATSSNQEDYKVQIAVLQQRVGTVESNMKDLDNDVRALRSELNAGIKQLSEQIAKINITLAKWIGIGTAVLFVGKLAADHFLK